MTENHKASDAFPTFYFGLRVALMGTGRDFSQEDVVKALECLDQIADGKTTSWDPSVGSEQWGGDGIGYRQLMNAAVRSEKDLAKEVREDFYRRLA